MGDDCTVYKIPSAGKTFNLCIFSHNTIMSLTVVILMDCVHVLLKLVTVLSKEL